MKTNRRNFLKRIGSLLGVSTLCIPILLSKRKFRKDDVVQITSDCDKSVAGLQGYIIRDMPDPELAHTAIAKHPYKVHLENGEKRWAEDRDLILVKRYEAA